MYHLECNLERARHIEEVRRSPETPRVLIFLIGVSETDLKFEPPFVSGSSTFINHLTIIISKLIPSSVITILDGYNTRIMRLRTIRRSFQAYIIGVKKNAKTFPLSQFAL